MLLEKDASGVFHHLKIQAEIVIARCPDCGKRIRVLPADVLPLKTYSLQAVECSVMEYAEGQTSLRNVSWSQYGDPTPVHSTVHGWTEGMGAHVRGLPGSNLDGLGFEQGCASLAARDGRVHDLLFQEPFVDERRYRSEPRRERLAALLILRSIAEIVTSLKPPHALTHLRHLILLFAELSALHFPSRILCTRIEHVDGASRAGSRPFLPEGAKICPTRTRSPPGDSNASQH